MSELKAYWIPTRSGNSCHCYLKSEADKVIAELKQKLEDEREFGLNRAKNADYEIGKLNEKINEAQTELELWRDGSIISEAHHGPRKPRRRRHARSVTLINGRSLNW